MRAKTLSFPVACLMVLVSITILGTGILYYGAAPQVPIFLCVMVLSFWALALGYSWRTVEQSIVKSVSAGLPSVFILCLIGMLIGVWVLGGTVPTLAYYGLSLLSPSFFLATSVLICAVVAIITGSSWSAISTMGVALMGVAYGMGIAPEMTAGAIVCGAIFGDKVSPLSDTTNLASATAEVDIFEHIRHMMWTAIPSLLVTIGLFLWMGSNNGAAHTDLSGIAEMADTLQTHFTISPLTLLSPLLIIVLAIRKTPAIPALMASFFVACATAFFTAKNVTPGLLMNVAYGGYEASTGIESVDALLSIGGLSAMMFGVSIILLSLAFGGVLQALDVPDVLLQGIVRLLTRKGHVISATVLSCIGVNTVIGEQYLSIVLPGQMLKKAYDENGLARKNLSRTLEDAGTIFHPAVPWGVTGAFIMSTLNVDMGYAPYVLLAFINPVIAIIYGYTGFSMPSSESKPA